MFPLILTVVLNGDGIRGGTTFSLVRAVSIRGTSRL